MTKALRARQRKKQKELNPVVLFKVMKTLFPKKNNYGQPPDMELVKDLARFGVHTLGQFQALMKRHRKLLIAEDKQRFTGNELRLYKQVFDPAHVKDAERCRYWYAHPALIRTAMELEFGPDAEKYE